jgi:hypothetical protein
MSRRSASAGSVVRWATLRPWTRRTPPLRAVGSRRSTRTNVSSSSATNDGYSVWRLEDLGEGEPIQRFADDDSGYELAADMWSALTHEDRRRRSPWLPVLKWVVITSAVLWAGASIFSSTILYLNQADAFRSGFRDFSGFFQVMEVVSAIGYSITLGATASYVVLWLDARRER